MDEPHDAAGAGALVCDGVSFTFPGAERAALREVRFTLQPGQCCALVGENGGGKSTLCRLLAGLYLPDEGAVWVEGHQVGQPAAEAQVRRLVQLVTEDPRYAVIGETVAEDVAFGLASLGLSGGQIAERVTWALEGCGVAHLRDQPTAGLSGGELQLVRLAGALAVAPRYLVLDEALSMVDGPARQRALDRLRALARQPEPGLAVLLATHHLDDLRWMDRVLWLDDRRLALSAPTAEALEALASDPDPPFDLPVALAVARGLRSRGWPVPLTLEADELVEAVCTSRS